MPSCLSGVLVIDKPSGLTSFAVVKVVRRLLKARKAGHTGTLDPMATGVLPICLEEATKIAGLLLAEDKIYEGAALLGVETDTQDITGRVLAEHHVTDVTEDKVEAVLSSMLGVQLQVPPAFSAVRCQGMRAYERARKGQEVKLAPREVNVQRLELRCWRPPYLDLYFECSKGTYVRSLVADLGRRLGCGATLSALRRTRSGPFELSMGVALDQLEERLSRNDLPIISMDRALEHLPVVEVEAEDMHHVYQGQSVELIGELLAGLYRIRHQGKLIALGEQREGRLWPKRVFFL